MKNVLLIVFAVILWVIIVLYAQWALQDVILDTSYASARATMTSSPIPTDGPGFQDMCDCTLYFPLIIRGLEQ